MAIRGESFEPGGCSACPTSPAAAATMRAPAPPPAIGAVGLTAPTAPGPTAFWSIPANELESPAAWAGGACVGGANADSRAEMRARTASMLTRQEIGPLALRLERAEGGRAEGRPVPSRCPLPSALCPLKRKRAGGLPATGPQASPPALAQEAQHPLR